MAENQHSYLQEKNEQGGIIYDEDNDITRYYLARDGSFTKRHIVRTDYWNPKVMRAYDSSLKEDETHPCNMEEIMMVTDLECDCHRDIRDSYQTYQERRY